MIQQQKNKGKRSVGGRRWGSGIAALLAINVMFGLAQASNEYRVLFLENMGMNATQCGRVLAAASLLTALSRPMGGALADKLRSRRTVYIGALFSWMAVLVLMLLTQNVRLAGFVLCAGIVPFISVSEPVTYGMIEASGANAAVMYPKLDYSLIRVCLSIGYCAINFLYTPIVDRFGPAAPFFCTLAYILVMLALSGTLRKFETVKQEGRVTGAPRQKLQVKRLFKNYFLVTFILLNFISAIGGHTQSYLVFLLDTVGLDKSLIGVTTGIRVAGEIIIMPLIPLIKRRVSLPMLQACTGVFTALQAVVFLTARNPYVILGATLLSGLSSGISLGTTAVYLRMMAPEGLDTTTLSLSTVMSSLGGIIISLVGGVIVDTLGIFSLYRISLCILGLWFVLYFVTWYVGVCVLKKTPPMPMFLKRNTTAQNK